VHGRLQERMGGRSNVGPALGIKGNQPPKIWKRRKLLQGSVKKIRKVVRPRGPVSFNGQKRARGTTKRLRGPCLKGETPPARKRCRVESNRLFHGRDV